MLEKSIGRYSVRKVLRFEMRPVGKTAETLSQFLEEDEQRAAALNTVKAVLEAKHLMFVRRVFKGLPDPLPTAAGIRAAFREDPEFEAMTGRNVKPVMATAVSQCARRGYGQLTTLRMMEHWPSLYVKWHWHCQEQMPLLGANSLPARWACRPKAEVERTSPVFRPPKKRKPSRNNWFDHAPFRMMFGNQTCGMSWHSDGFHASRTILLLDEAGGIFVGVVPRYARLEPFRMPEPDAAAYSLYEESGDEPPRLRRVAKGEIDLAVRTGALLLFELTGRGLRGSSNLNAAYLRALLSEDNFREGAIHLDGDAEFHVRKGTEMPRDGKPDHFRQRFAEDRLFVTFRLTFNAHLAGISARVQPWGDLANFIARHPEAKFVDVSGVSARQDVPKLVGDLARRVIAEDAAVLFAPSVPESVRRAVKDKFDYVVLKGRAPNEDGGVLRGYQLSDRLFVGDLDKANEKLRAQNEELRRRRQEIGAVQREEAANAAAKQRRREHHAELQRIAQEKRAAAERMRAAYDGDVFQAPLFQAGRYLFRVTYKTSQNIQMEVDCRADERDEVYQKMRTVGVRPSRVTSDDPAYLADQQAKKGALTVDERLKRLAALKAQGLLTDEECAAQRARIISEL